MRVADIKRTGGNVRTSMKVSTLSCSSISSTNSLPFPSVFLRFADTIPDDHHDEQAGLSYAILPNLRHQAFPKSMYRGHGRGGGVLHRILLRNNVPMHAHAQNLQSQGCQGTLHQLRLAKVSSRLYPRQPRIRILTALTDGPTPSVTSSPTSLFSSSQFP